MDRTRIQPLIQEFKAFPWQNREMYSSWLAQTYYYVAYSTRMLAFAAGSTTPEQQEFYKRCIQHIKEESGHEAIALSDLRKMGGDISSYPQLLATKTLWETQFAKMTKAPTAVLGYILALEELAVSACTDAYTQVSIAHGPNTGHFLRVHAEEDPHHVEEAVEQINLLSKAERDLVIENYNQTIFLYSMMLKEIVAEGSKQIYKPTTVQADL